MVTNSVRTRSVLRSRTILRSGEHGTIRNDQTIVTARCSSIVQLVSEIFLMARPIRLLSVNAIRCTATLEHGLASGTRVVVGRVVFSITSDTVNTRSTSRNRQTDIITTAAARASAVCTPVALNSCTAMDRSDLSARTFMRTGRTLGPFLLAQILEPSNVSVTEPMDSLWVTTRTC